MKSVVLIITLLLGIMITRGAHVFNSPVEDEILKHIQGNNYNVYLLYFVDSKTKDQNAISIMKNIENNFVWFKFNILYNPQSSANT